MDYLGRQTRLQRALSQNRLDALLITHLPNVRYLCGFTGSAAALLLTAKANLFFSDGRYGDQARAEVQGARILIARKAPVTAAAEWLGAHRTRISRNGRAHLGVEGEHLSAGAYLRLEATLGRNFKLKTAPAIVELARMLKDEDEIEHIRAAVKLGTGLWPHALKAIRPGVKESAVAGKMEYAARKAGAEGMSFATIIASGQRSAQPHGRATDAPIPARGFVTCDFGVILAGYCSDMTRTVHVGKPSAQARQVYEAVQDAQQAAVEAVRPGQTVGEVDRAARSLLQKRGLGAYFTHSTGHGVGLEIHEAPRLAARLEEVLRPGMVITVEPGVYLPGRWGVRIEDMVVVNQRGCEVLTRTSKDLMSV
jgi:Xaa-Pro aminopeptidase